jgi:hypothetical protein
MSVMTAAVSQSAAADVCATCRSRTPCAHALYSNLCTSLARTPCTTDAAAATLHGCAAVANPELMCTA